MIRRSTLVFLTCMTALISPTMRGPIAASAEAAQPLASSQIDLKALIVAQGESAGGEAASSAGDQSQQRPQGELSLGDRGEAVRVVQERLQQSGFYDGLVDGVYGLGTQRAVSDFQADMGLEITGKLNDETWKQFQQLPTSPDGALGDVNAQTNGATQGSSALPATAPTESELPDIEGNGQRVEGPVSDDRGGAGRIVGLSFGLAALLASFGIGFYIANRGKGEAEASEGGEWGEIAPIGLSGAPAAATSYSLAPAISSAPTMSASNRAAALRGESQGVSQGINGQLTNSPSTQASSSEMTTGQMGEATPLAQIDIIEGLIGDLRSPDPSRRRKVIWELGQRGNSVAMQPLVNSMESADSKEKSLILAALSEISIRSLKPMSRALAISLQDENPEVRKNAIRDLTRVFDLIAQISQMLGPATEDEDPEVRQTAAWALEQLNRIRRSPELDTSTIRTIPGGATTPIDLLSSEASMRRSSQQG